MNAEQKRIAIAEACGWVFDHIRNGAMYYVPTRDIHVGNPLTDLNAMYEAEKVLTHDQQDDFVYYIAEIAAPITGEKWACIHATAAQRADAFLITLGILKP